MKLNPLTSFNKTGQRFYILRAEAKRHVNEFKFSELE